MPIDKKDGAGESAGRTGDIPGQKRPHATLDLKATEVTPPAKGSAPEAPGGADKPAEAEPLADVKAADSPAAGAKASPPKGGPFPGGKPAEAKTSPLAAPPSGTRRGGGILSHLLAGLAGGALALALLDWAGPKLGMPRPGDALQQQTAELQKRIAAVEQANSAGDLKAKLADAEARVAKLEGAADALGTAQNKFAEETKGLAGRLAANPMPPEAEKRLTALDERLATIAASADNDPGKGVIPQVASLTGKVKDLQSSLNAELDALRKSMPLDADERLTELKHQTEGAQEGLTRLERDMADAKLEVTRQTQRLETFKADIVKATTAARVLQEETGKLSSGLEEMKTNIASQVKGGVGAAVTPVMSKIGTLEANLDALTKGEAERRTNAERIVVSLELANLKRLIDSGQSYAAALADVRKAAGEKLDLGALDRFKDTGVPTIAELQRDFRPVANAVIDAAEAPAEGSVFDRLMAGAKSVVRVRNVNPAPGDKSVEATVARMQEALSLGQLDDVLAFAKELPAASSVPAQDWLTKVEARHAVDRVIGNIEMQLKSSLTSTGIEARPNTPTAPAAPAAPPAPAASVPPSPYDAQRLPAPGSMTSPGTTEPAPADKVQP